MIAHRHTAKIVAVLMAAAVCLCLCAAAFYEPSEAGGFTMEYESRLFDTSAPIRVDIRMEDGQWEKMLNEAMSEDYYQCDVEIQGETFYRVGIRPKGNTSLSSIAQDPDTDRYSFKLEFDQYEKGQTCFGLDKLVLNNNYADATNMKEALVYDMFQYLGADASLYNYAEIYINGEYWGIYLALEAVEDSFLLRNYGLEQGELYKPENMGRGGGGAPGGGGPEGFDPAGFAGGPPEGFDPAGFAGGPPEGFDPANFEGKLPEGFGPPQMGGGPGQGGGSDLNYTDDSLDSYSTIWDGEVTKSGKRDHRRVIAALKNISEGTDLEGSMDVDNLLRYMAVHEFAVNQDSLSGNMAHNYYLYESGGRLNLLPWDYNLSLGGMGRGGDASGTINDAVDTPFSGTNFFDGLLEDEGYLAQYHDYLRKLVDGYVEGGGFDAFYERTRSRIDALVAADPTAFYTCEAYETAAELLYKVVKLRAESISGQLEGTIPSTDAGQREDPSALVDASGLDLSVMGVMDMGGGPDGARSFGPRKDGEGGPNGAEQAPPNAPDGQGRGPGQQKMPPAGGRSDSGNGLPAAAQNGVLYGVSIFLMLAALLFAARYRRRSRRR